MTMPKTTDKPDALTRLLAIWTDLTARKAALDAQLRVCVVCGAEPPLEFCLEHVPVIVAMEEECDSYCREHFPALVRMIEEGLVCDECCAGLRDAWNAIAEEVLGK